MPARKTQGMELPGLPGWERKLWSFACGIKSAQLSICRGCTEREKGSYCVIDNIKGLAELRGGRGRLAALSPLRQLDHCRFHQCARALAQKCLDKAGIDRPPVPDEIVYQIDPKKRIEVRLLPLKRYHGALWHIDDSWIIYLNSNDAPGRRRIALFHEYFHILANCKGQKLFASSKVKIAEQSLPTEIFADSFAALLLVPRQWILDAFPKIRDVKQIAAICNVDGATAYAVLKVYGLI